LDFAVGQDIQGQKIIGEWGIVKDSHNSMDLFSSKYSFQFNKDKKFLILKPIEGKIEMRVDETGTYELIKDSIEIKIIQEDGIDLVTPQSITFKVIRLSESELILQWPKLVNINDRKQYPELKFKKE